MLRKYIAPLMVTSLLVSIPLASSAIADSKNGKKDSNKGQTTILANEWILPASKKSPILVQAGRTLPIKFKLVENGAALQSTNLVTLSYVKLNGCQTNSIPEPNFSPIVIAPTTVSPAVTSSPTTSPTSSPTATASPAATASSSPTSSPTTASSPSPSEVEKRSVLQFEKGAFVFNWKVPKNLNDGCYRLIAQKGTSPSFQSPVLRVKLGR